MFIIQTVDSFMKICRQTIKISNLFVMLLEDIGFKRDIISYLEYGFTSKDIM